MAYMLGTVGERVLITYREVVLGECQAHSFTLC